MYGKTCVGIVVDDVDLLELGAAIAETIEDEELRKALIGGSRTDSMGYSTIVYWSRVSCSDAPEEDDEDE